MAEDLLGVLTRFHREVVVPDMEGIVARALDAKVTPLREEMLANFAAVFERLDRLESDYTALSAAVARIEQRLGALEQKIAEMEARL